MDTESDVIKHQMEHTRSALTDKLELLEHQVTDTVTGAAETVEKVRHTVQETMSGAAETVEKVRHAVQETVSGAAETVASMKHAFQDTVESVRESVRETTATVTESLDVRKQVQKHPWAMMAGATAVGFGVGILASRVDVPKAASSVKSMTRHSNGVEGNNGGWSGPPPSVFQQAKRQGGNGRAQGQEPHEESPWTPAVNKLKGLAIGAMFGVLRDMLSKSMPDAISGQVGEVIDNFTTTLGGKPIAGKVLPDSWNGNQPASQSTERDWQGGGPRPRQTTMVDIEE